MIKLWILNISDLNLVVFYAILLRNVEDAVLMVLPVNVNPVERVAVVIVVVN